MVKCYDDYKKEFFLYEKKDRWLGIHVGWNGPTCCCDFQCCKTFTHNHGKSNKKGKDILYYSRNLIYFQALVRGFLIRQKKRRDKRFFALCVLLKGTYLNNNNIRNIVEFVV